MKTPTRLPFHIVYKPDLITRTEQQFLMLKSCLLFEKTKKSIIRVLVVPEILLKG